MLTNRFLAFPIFAAVMFFVYFVSVSWLGGMAADWVNNVFFGESVTVSGLLTGQDIISQLAGKRLGDAVLIPGSALRFGESVFLDDVTVSDVENALGVPVLPVKVSGKSFVRAVLK